MKNIFQALKLTVLSFLLFAVLYPLLISGIASLTESKGKGETVKLNGKTVGFKLIGQSFTTTNYFWGRPSAVNYNAAGSGGSNKGPTNPAYLKEVQARVDSFLVYHPYLSKNDIPAEMVTASGSGLDPDISPESAKIQVKRIAQITGIEESKLLTLIAKNTNQPALGFFGRPTVNVLNLNIQLNQLTTTKE